ncbi:hypothetical protein PpBr36_07282 [Pyricularia pennisetigena]|uniref:hypothetical protein n=1 Tax=Pyricularia pennisetigena TaxID=1578925 RepID=UPI00114E2239|nr:hypothetical protein PpBr36_07282 [Pyricularia pennisetigena]TLS25706.1 hypothetical protein PpBr36_07282 [Pyricularia pennisetigena]
MSTRPSKPINTKTNTVKTRRDKPPSPESPSSNGIDTPTNSEGDDYASAPSTKGSSFASLGKTLTASMIDSADHPLQGAAALTEVSLANAPPILGQESLAHGHRNRDFGPIGPRPKLPLTPQLTRTRGDESFGWYNNPFATRPDLAGRRDAIDFGTRGTGLGSSQQLPVVFSAWRQPHTPARNSPWPQRSLFSSSIGSSSSRGPAIFSPASNHSSPSTHSPFVDSPPSPLARYEEKHLRAQAVQPSPLQQAQCRIYAGSPFSIRADLLRNNNNNSPDNNETFRPMHTVQVRHHSGSPRHGQQSPSKAIQNIMNGFSPNYQGDTSLANNRSANIPESESCSLFILGLPPTLTTTQLLGAIRDTGRVWASHINKPEPSRGHATCAAKVIFFERAAARRFYEAHQPHNGGFVTDPASGLPPARVLWNRIRSAEVGPPSTGASGDKSRVLLIYGPQRKISEKWLTDYFAGKMDFQIDRAFELARDVNPVTGEIMVLFEYRFGSFRCQAEAAKMALAREHKNEIQVWYGDDPCAPRRPGPAPVHRWPAGSLWPAASPYVSRQLRFDGYNCQ